MQLQQADGLGELSVEFEAIGCLRGREADETHESYGPRPVLPAARDRVQQPLRGAVRQAVVDNDDVGPNSPDVRLCLAHRGCDQGDSAPGANRSLDQRPRRRVA